MGARRHSARCNSQLLELCAASHTQQPGSPWSSSTHPARPESRGRWPPRAGPPASGRWPPARRWQVRGGAGVGVAAGGSVRRRRATSSRPPLDSWRPRKACPRQQRCRPHSTEQPSTGGSTAPKSSLVFHHQIDGQALCRQRSIAGPEVSLQLLGAAQRQHRLVNLGGAVKNGCHSAGLSACAQPSSGRRGMAGGHAVPPM